MIESWFGDNNDTSMTPAAEVVGAELAIRYEAYCASLGPLHSVHQGGRRKTETELVREALWALQGHPGKVYNTGFEVVGDVAVSHATPSAIVSVMAGFGSHARDVARLRKLASLAGPPPTALFGTVFQAFAHYTGHHLDTIVVPRLAELEAEATRVQTAAGVGDTLSLIGLGTKIDALLPPIRALLGLADSVLPPGWDTIIPDTPILPAGSEVNTAAIAGSLLSQTYAYGHQHRDAVVMAAFHACLTPYLGLLAQLARTGLVNDPANEFMFVCSSRPSHDKSGSPTDPAAWDALFTLRPGNAVPSFLRSIVPELQALAQARNLESSLDLDINISGHDWDTLLSWSSPLAAADAALARASISSARTAVLDSVTRIPGRGFEASSGPRVWDVGAGYFAGTSVSPQLELAPDYTRGAPYFVSFVPESTAPHAAHGIEGPILISPDPPSPNHQGQGDDHGAGDGSSGNMVGASKYVRQDVRQIVEGISVRVSGQVMEAIRGQIVAYLSRARDVFFLGSGDLMDGFCRVLFEREGQGSLGWGTELELNLSLQEKVEGLTVSVGSSSSSSSSSIIENLEVTFDELPWPVSGVIREAHLKAYNRILRFLLEIRCAKAGLVDLVLGGRGERAGSGASAGTKLHWLRLFRAQLLHFVSNLELYMLSRVVESSWAPLMEGLESARTLDEMTELHGRYLTTIQDRCLMGDKARVVREGIRKVLDLCIRFRCSFLDYVDAVAEFSVRTEAALEQAFEDMSGMFRKCVGFLLTLLARITAGGGFVHLQDLYIRLDFSGYYASSSSSV